MRREFRAAGSSRAMNVSFSPRCHFCGEGVLVKESIKMGASRAAFQALRSPPLGLMFKPGYRNLS